MAQYTIDLPCIADTYVAWNALSSNYGTAETLNAGGYAGGSPFLRKYYTIMKFNFSALPSPLPRILSAKMRVFSAKPMPSGTNAGIIWGIHNQNFGEYTANYTNQGDKTGGTLEHFQDGINSGEWVLFGDLSKKIGQPDLTNNGIYFYWADGFSEDFWQVSSRESANKPVLRVVCEDELPDKPVPQSPIGVFRDNASVVRFSWQYISSTGDTQAKFDLQWSTDQATWTTISQTSGNTYYDMPASTLPVGTIYWRVRITNENNVVGEYCDAVAFYSIGAPASAEIYRVTNDCRPTIFWDAEGQQVYQVQVLKGANVIYDTGNLPGIETKNHKVRAFLEDGHYIARVRIKNEYDIWSVWDSLEFVLDTVKPAKPSLAAQRAPYGVELTIGGTQISYIYRDGVCIAAVTGSKYFDNAAVCGKEHLYFVRTISGNGFSDSDIVPCTASFRYGILSDAEDIIECRYNINAVPGKNTTNAQSGTTNYFDGRKYPVFEHSEHTEFTMSFTYFFKQYSDVQRIIDMSDRKNVVLYRDAKGRKVYGALTSVSVQDNLHGYSVSFTITATDYNEVVEI